MAVACVLELSTKRDTRCKMDGWMDGWMEVGRQTQRFTFRNWLMKL